MSQAKVDRYKEEKANIDKEHLNYEPGESG